MSSQEARPGTARVLVTEMRLSGNMNPDPVIQTYDDTGSADDVYLSVEKLETLCGTQDLSHITSLEICVDTREKTLGNFGVYLPRLAQLKMNNSAIISVRDLGTSLSHLQVMWMSRCCLQDLDGISIYTSLRELYVAYNRVSDLSQVGLLENLQLLDLEGNDVDDLVQVQYLGLCSQLRILTLDGNPVCLRPNTTSTQVEDYSYRAAVRELIPQLRYLDDVKVEEDGQSDCSTMGKDWEILQNSIKDCNTTTHAACEEEESADGARPYSTHRRPASSISCFRPLTSHAGSRLQTRQGLLSPPGSRPGSADSDLAAVEAETSALTHGAGKILFCGNPVKAMRAKREKLRTAPTRSSLNTQILPIHVPEHTYDLEEPEFTERANVFAELRAWREQHSRRLQVIERERLPEVLAIRHDDEDEAESDDDEEGFAGMRSDSSDEEHGDSQSPDSSLQSPSPDFSSPDMAGLCLSLDAPLSCVPPKSTVGSGSNRKLTGFRARRLRLSLDSSQHSADVRNETSLDSDLGKIPQMIKSNEFIGSLRAHKAHNPVMSAHADPLNHSCEKRNQRQKHLTSNTFIRPAISRPHTAMAALQKHQLQHLLRPNPPPD
ncbi:leucine-rich repeat-containing protein 56 isoform X2 [Gouania willdenowi]|nr:leucine-rich repeat-containing protein 56 isoform X2 [Gouania willdenowi]